MKSSASSTPSVIAIAWAAISGATLEGATETSRMW